MVLRPFARPSTRPTSDLRSAFTRNASVTLRPLTVTEGFCGTPAALFTSRRGWPALTRSARLEMVAIVSVSPAARGCADATQRQTPANAAMAVTSRMGALLAGRPEGRPLQSVHL